MTLAEATTKLNQIYVTLNENQVKGLGNFLKYKHPDLYQIVNQYKDRLHVDTSTALYLVKFGLTEIPKCKNCGTSVKLVYKNGEKKFSDLCPKCALREAGSRSCSDAETRKKMTEGHRRSTKAQMEEKRKLKEVELERKRSLVNLDYVRTLVITLVNRNKELKRENIGGVVSALRSETEHPGVYQFLNNLMTTMGAKSMTEVIYLLYHHMDSVPMCPDCGVNKRSFIDINKGYQQGCTNCNAIRSRDILGNFKRVYHADNPMQVKELRDQVTEKMQDPEVIAKKQATTEATNIAKYGVKSTLQVKEFRQKGEQRRLEETGYSHHMKDPIQKQNFHNRIASTDEYKANVADIVAQLGKHGYTLVRPYYNAGNALYVKCNRCGTEFEAPCWNAIRSDHNHIETLCKKCFPPKCGGSLDEERIYQFLKEKMPIEEIVHKHGSRLIIGDGRELDIYVPKYKTAIEYCGLYTHNSSNEHHSGKVVPSNYHISKYLLCKEKGIRLITIFDKRKSDNYIQEIYESMIGNDPIKFEDLKLYMKDGSWYYNLDNTWTSYEFFKFKYMFDLIEQHEQVCWFYDDKYHCSFISYDDFKEGYCSNTDDVFEVARRSVYSKWYYDCGYQLLKLKDEYIREIMQ